MVQKSMLFTPRRCHLCNLFIYVKLLEFIAGAATLGYVSLYDKYHILIPDPEQLVGIFVFGLMLAFMYEIVSNYFLISAAAWALFCLPKLRRWLPLSVPVVYMVHSTLCWKYFLGGNGSWPWGIPVVALFDCCIAAYVLRHDSSMSLAKEAGE